MTLLGSVLKLNLKTAIESAFLINDSTPNRIVPQLAENPYHCAKLEKFIIKIVYKQKIDGRHA